MLVLLDAKKLKVYYVAQITEVIICNKFGVSFMRLKVKDNMKFYMPLENDFSEIHMNEIKMILPPPQINGWKFRNSTYVLRDTKYEVALIFHFLLLILWEIILPMLFFILFVIVVNWHLLIVSNYNVNVAN